MKPTDGLAYDLGRCVGRFIAQTSQKYTAEQIHAMLPVALEQVAGQYETIHEVKNAIGEFQE